MFHGVYTNSLWYQTLDVVMVARPLFFQGFCSSTIMNLNYFTFHATAVKCRPYLPVVKVMAEMGLGFDCASKVCEGSC